MTTPTPEQIDAAIKWTKRKINLHRNYIDTFHDHTDTHTARQVRHKTNQCAVLEVNLLALKFMRDKLLEKAGENNGV